MPRVCSFLVLIAALVQASCASLLKPSDCQADVSPEGYDLILRTVPNARVDYRIGKAQKTLSTTSGIEKIGTSADEVEIIRCVRETSGK
jgi:hypothetical protein